MGILLCPGCEKPLEINSLAKDGSKYQCTCRNCLKYWDLIRYDMSDDDIKESAQQS